RAVTARATFLCLCKETWRKESTPRLRARRFASGSRSRRDFPRGHPAPTENAAHPCAAPLRGLVRRLRRYGGAPKINGSRATATPLCRSGGSRELLIGRDSAKARGFRRSYRFPAPAHRTSLVGRVSTRRSSAITIGRTAHGGSRPPLL